MSAEIADLFVILNSVTDPFSAGMKKAAADAEAQTKRMNTALGAVTKIGIGLGATVLGIGVASIKAATSFQSEMTKLVTQAGVGQAQMAALNKGVLALAGQVGFSPTSLAQSLYHVESNFQSLGISSDKALSLVKIAAEGAAVGGADLVDVTNALTAAVASGIPGVQNMSDAMGALNKIVGVGDMSMQDLADAFSTGLLATVRGFGVTLADVGAALATFGDNNIRGAQAGTELRMAVEALAKPAATAGDTLTKLGLKTDTLAKDMQQGGLKQALTDLMDRMNKAGVKADQQGQIITDAFGKKAGTGINILIGQFGRVMSKYPDLQSGASGFAAAWEQTKNTFGQQMKQIGAGVDALGIRIGQYLIPQVSKLITLGQSDLGQITSGFTGADHAPPTHPAMGNAFLNREMTPAAPPLTGWQKFGDTLRQVLTDIEHGAERLKPVEQDFVRFGQDAWQALGKIVQAGEPVAKLLGGGLMLAVEAVGKTLANVAGPALKDFANFLADHQGLVKFFAEVILGALITKMTILGSINAAKSVVELATSIAQFPLSQAGQIKTTFDELRTAWAGKEAVEGEKAVVGLKGAINDLKGAASGALDKFPLFNAGKLANLAKAGEDLSQVEKAASATSGLKTVANDAESVAASGGKASTSMLGLAGSLGKAALPMVAIIGGAGLLGNYLGHLAGVGRSLAPDIDKLTAAMTQAAGGSAQAKQQISLLAQAMTVAPFHIGAASMNDVDKALTQLVSSGHAADAKTEFDQITQALQKQGMSAHDAAAKFPQYEQALKDAAAAAQSADGKVQSLLGTLSQQQSLDQFASDLNNITTAAAQNGRTLSGNTDQAIANRQAFSAAASDIENYYQQQRNAGVPIQQATSDMQKQVDQLEATGIKAFGSKVAIDAYLKSLGLVPSSVSTDVVLNVGRAYQELNGLLQTIDSSVGYVQVTGISSTGGPGGKAYLPSKDVGGFIEGGAKGSPILMIGHVGEYVLSNDMQAGRQRIDPKVLAGMGMRSTGYTPTGGGGGGSVTYVTNHYHIAGSVIAEAQLLALTQKNSLQYSTRNQSNGMSYTPVR